MVKKEQSEICDVCGGTGRLSFLKGVSRFLLSHDECPECAGTGHILDSEKNQTENSGNSKKRIRINKIPDINYDSFYFFEVNRYG